MLVKHTLKASNNKIMRFHRCYSSRNMIRLKDRGMYQELFPELSVNEIMNLLNSQPQWVYAGFDPTSDSLHVGNLLVLQNLLHWQRGGHNVIAVVGGATAKIGDPSGRSTERDVLSSSSIDNNVKGLYANIQRVFENHKKYFWLDQGRQLVDVSIVNNESWYKDLSAIELISGAGQHLRMGTLLSRTSVQSRLASPTGMNFTEFSYQLFQSYDWLHLFQKYGCRFQIGGNDQMGNIMSGHDLISKTCKTPVYGLTLPLITTEMGDKFGKSAGNAIWLSSKRTSPFAFYQFWIRTADADVERLLKLFTFDATGEISDIMKRHDKQPELRLAQKRLAERVTVLVHGQEGLKEAETASKTLYEGSVASLGEMKAEDVARMFQGACVVQLLPEAGQTVVDMAMDAGCFPTRFVADDAVRIITAGGFYINQKRAVNPNEVLNPAVHRLANNISFVRVGKKNYYIVKWTL